jgi:hypothetical protein
MYLVVTVTVDRHQVAQGVIPAVLIAVMDFQQRFWQEDEVTIATTSMLELQERCDPAGDPRVGTAARCPITPVTIEGACRAFHFPVPTNRRGRVRGEQGPGFGAKAPAPSLLKVPVLLSNPSSGSVAKLTITVCYPQLVVLFLPKRFNIQYDSETLRQNRMPSGACFVSVRCPVDC